jgi:pimeloyl-ACP methyl ester carboxylesterase
MCGMTTFLMVPGAGGDGWYWSRVVPLLERRGDRAVTVTLPAADEEAGLDDYAAAVVAAAPDGPVTLVAQSMGSYAASIAATKLDVVDFVLVNAMVPVPGETPGDWWEAVGQPAAAARSAAEDGRPEELDPVRDFFHDVPPETVEEAMQRGEPRQADRPFDAPWPLERWPEVPTRGLAGADDRLFPPAFQQRVARERLGLELDVAPGGHLVALARPDVVADHLARGPRAT